MKVFNNALGVYDDKSYLNAIKKINELSKNGIEYLEPEFINELVCLHEKSAVSLRKKLEDCEEEIDLGYTPKNGFDKKNSKCYLENLPITIEEKNNIYHIFTPYTFKKGMQESFELSTMLHGELCRKEQEGFKIKISEKTVVSVVRVSKKFVGNQIKDNDNLETSRMINTIFGEHLGTSDNAKNMSFFCDYVTSNDENLLGFHLFLIPYSFGEFRGENLLKMFEKN